VNIENVLLHVLVCVYALEFVCWPLRVFVLVRVPRVWRARPRVCLCVSALCVLEMPRLEDPTKICVLNMPAMSQGERE